MMAREALEAALAWEWEFVRDVQNSNPNPRIAQAGVDMVHVAFAAARKQLALMAEKCPQQSCIDGLDTGSFRQGAADCRTCRGSGKVYPPETVEKIAKAVGEMFLYPDPHNEGNWMGPGIQASRQVAVAVLDALGDSE